MLESIEINVSRLKAVRSLRGWTIDDVVQRSRSLGYPTNPGEVSRLENGKLPFSEKKAAQFAAVFEVAPEWLSGTSDSPSPALQEAEAS